MTHLFNLETLQFAAKVKENYPGMLNRKLNLFNFKAKTLSSQFCRNFRAAHWPHNLANFHESG